MYYIVVLVKLFFFPYVIKKLAKTKNKIFCFLNLCCCSR